MKIVINYKITIARVRCLIYKNKYKVQLSFTVN
jgi:hypothetical protein